MTINPHEFKAPFITKKDAWAAADDTRRRHWQSDEVPVEVEEIVDGVGLELKPIWSLRGAGDVDALLNGYLRVIVIDAEDYMDDRMQTRMRFSIAHELGHYVLHRKIYEDIVFNSVDEWIEFSKAIPEDQYGFVEQHAYEFAGRLLVPSDRLKVELDSAVEQAKSAGFGEWDKSGDAAREYMASSICRVFGVSSQVIEKRITREQLWPPA